jgi:hypothetical protein
MTGAYGRMLMVTLALTALLIVVTPVASRAAAQESDTCPTEATIASLQTCVLHAAQMGCIDNAGVTQSLLAELDAAASAADRGQPLVAVQAIQAFMNEVTVQAGVHIDAEHAEHMLAHARAVIQALGGS